MRGLIYGLLAVCILVIIGTLVSNYVVGSYSVPGSNMYPNIFSGEQLLVSKIAYNFDQPQRGDVICYESSTDGSAELKRIVGIPGDYIEIKNKALYINGNKVNEPYARVRTDLTLPPTQVQLNTYFVLDDNRQADIDDNNIVPRQNIVGRAWVCAWPPDRWGGVENFALDAQIEAAEVP